MLEYETLTLEAPTGGDDPELDAISMCQVVLNLLSAPQRQRVLEFLISRNSTAIDIMEMGSGVVGTYVD